MEVILWLACLVGGAAATYGMAAFARDRRRRRGLERRALMEACGLEVTGVAEDGTVSGRHGALDVRLSSYVRGNSHGTRVTITGLVPDLEIGRGRWIGRTLGGRDLEIGHEFFDDEFQLGGTPLTVRALLDARTRAMVSHAFTDHAETRVADGTLRSDFEERMGGRSRLTPAALGDLVALGQALAPLASPAARLAAIARTDHTPSVRAGALQALAEGMADDDETREALRAGTRDPEPSVRLLAARALGAEGEPILRGLVANTSVDDALAADALAALGDRATVDEARPVLARAAAVGKVRLALAALRVVAQGGAPEVPALAATLRVARGRIAVAAAEALATVGGPAAEAPLVAALRGSESPVAVAAAQALARCGTVAAVPDLKDAEARGGELGSAARTGIAAIQARLKGASRGQVSLSDGGAGQLSVADAAGGRVSLDRGKP